MSVTWISPECLFLRRDKALRPATRAMTASTRVAASARNRAYCETKLLIMRWDSPWLLGRRARPAGGLLPACSGGSTWVSSRPTATPPAAGHATHLRLLQRLYFFVDAFLRARARLACRECLSSALANVPRPPPGRLAAGEPGNYIEMRGWPANGSPGRGSTPNRGDQDDDTRTCTGSPVCDGGRGLYRHAPAGGWPDIW